MDGVWPAALASPLRDVRKRWRRLCASPSRSVGHRAVGGYGRGLWRCRVRDGAEQGRVSEHAYDRKVERRVVGGQRLEEVGPF